MNPQLVVFGCAAAAGAAALVTLWWLDRAAQRDRVRMGAAPRTVRPKR